MRIICLIPDNNEVVKYAVKFTFDVKVYGKICTIGRQETNYG